MPNRFTDQLGSEISLPQFPSRIISLVPSQTELLYDIGLEDEVIGITRFCVHPMRWRSEKKIVGGTKNISADLIEALKPDLIIGNKEENDLQAIVKLKKKFPVWMSDVVSFRSAYEMISSVGQLTNHEKEAQRIVDEIQKSFQSLKTLPSFRTLYLIWREPWMAAGRETFINSMMEKIGLINACSEKRYPNLTNEQIRNIDPELVFLPTEPFPFREKHIQELRLLVPDAKIRVVDGEMFSWYGSRMRLAPAYFDSIRIE